MKLNEDDRIAAWLIPAILLTALALAWLASSGCAPRYWCDSEQCSPIGHYHGQKPAEASPVYIYVTNTVVIEKHIQVPAEPYRGWNGDPYHTIPWPQPKMLEPQWIPGIVTTNFGTIVVTNVCGGWITITTNAIK